MYEGMNKWTNECMNEWKNGRINECDGRVLETLWSWKYDNVISLPQGVYSRV